MKALIILSLSLISLSAFSSEVGEDKTAGSDCSRTRALDKRETKVASQFVKEEVKKEEVKTEAQGISR